MAYFISRLLCAFYPNNKYEVPTTSGIPTTESELFLKQFTLERKKTSIDYKTVQQYGRYSKYIGEEISSKLETGREIFYRKFHMPLKSSEFLYRIPHYHFSFLCWKASLFMSFLRVASLIRVSLISQLAVTLSLVSLS